jgi:phage terminase large subunit-like protein
VLANVSGASPGRKLLPIAAVSPEKSRGERCIAFIERYLKIPEGTHQGKPMLLDDFQKRFILAVFDNPHGTDTGILSMARKNGKTALIAALVIVFLAGPEARENAQLISGARSRAQASLVFKLACKMIASSSQIAPMIRVIPSTSTLIGLAKNVEYKAISAEAGTAHGLSPYVAILDEVGQVRGEQDDFIEAIVTAQGAYDDAMKLIISTQAPNDSDLLSVMIDDAMRSNDPHTVCHLYAAEPDCDLDDEDQWRKANPALGTFRSESDFRKQATKAERMPSFESSFRNLNLNQRVNRNNPFVAPTTWRKNMAAPDDDAFKRYPVYGGLDLSKTTDLTAFVLCCADEEGQVHVKSYFWKPANTIDEHQRRDRAPYVRWRDEGFIFTTPGNAIEYAYVAKQIATLTAGMDIKTIGFDSWKFADLATHFEASGLKEDMFEKVIQGPRTMAPMLDALEADLLAARVHHGGHPVLTMCAANAVIIIDTNENRKLDKAKSTGRIDGMVALAMANGMRTRRVDNRTETPPEIHVGVFRLGR